MLGDAAAAKPPLLKYNPALRQRNRGRRTGRKLALSPQRAWATPLQTLLLAERAALVSGQASNFTLVVTIGYTGLRWGEAIGLEHAFLKPGAIHVEWQLREINGTFHRIPPKDDSYRSPNWEPCLPIDLPPFLISLLARQAEATAGLRCACAKIHEGSGRYLFTGTDGGHYRRSNYARRIFRPACDGRYPSASGRRTRQADHCRHHHPARHPDRCLACRAAAHRRPGQQHLDSAARSRNPCDPGRHPDRMLAPDPARTDPARITA